MTLNLLINKNISIRILNLKHFFLEQRHQVKFIVGIRKSYKINSIFFGTFFGISNNAIIQWDKRILKTQEEGIWTLRDLTWSDKIFVPIQISSGSSNFNLSKFFFNLHIMYNPKIRFWLSVSFFIWSHLTIQVDFPYEKLIHF